MFKEFAFKFATGCLYLHHIVSLLFISLLLGQLILNDHSVHDALVRHHLARRLLFNDIVVQHADLLEESLALAIFLVIIFKLGLYRMLI